MIYELIIAGLLLVNFNPNTRQRKNFELACELASNISKRTWLESIAATCPLNDNQSYQYRRVSNCTEREILGSAMGDRGREQQ